MDTPPPAPSLEPVPGISSDDKLWAAIAHFSSLAVYASGVGHILGPLIIWLWKRDTSPFVAEEAKEALNFNISITIYGVIAGVLVLVFVGVFLLAALGIFHLVFVIVAGLKALEGRPYRYPLNLRLIK
jgi:uncharacterized protein